jgi:hypothetical protein
MVIASPSLSRVRRRIAVPMPVEDKRHAVSAPAEFHYRYCEPHWNQEWLFSGGTILSYSRDGNR